MADTWITDMRHYLNEFGELPDLRMGRNTLGSEDTRCIAELGLKAERHRGGSSKGRGGVGGTGTCGRTSTLTKDHDESHEQTRNHPADRKVRYTTLSGLGMWLHLFPGWRFAYPGLQYKTPSAFGNRPCGSARTSHDHRPVSVSSFFGRMVALAARCTQCALRAGKGIEY